MADLADNWSTNSNEAVTISLVAPADTGSRTVASFHPKFTYPIFGDEESIFGYQGLKIHLRYHACDMRPGLQITYNKKFKAHGETSATNINEVLDPFLPKIAFEKSSVFDAAIRDDIFKHWKPPGEFYETGNLEDASFEIWKGSMADKAIQQLVKRVQILIPFFIEGGQAINLEDPDWSLQRWTAFFLYKRMRDASMSSPYVLMGYSTVYRYFYLPPALLSPTIKKTPVARPATLEFQFPFPESSTLDLPCRSRISQFLILPPFQRGGNGSRFYEAIFAYCFSHLQTIEITVEDPNESFDDLRDLNDLKRLRNMPGFVSLRINNDVTARKKRSLPTGKIVDLIAIEALRRKTKIAPRQFFRMVEMQLLSLIPTYIRKSLILESKKGDPLELKAKEHEYYLWRLFVKQRLYRHNKDSLIQLDRAERIDKLEEVLDNVEADYARLLRTLDQRSNKSANGADDGNGKRLATGDQAEGEPLTKRVKLKDG